MVWRFCMTHFKHGLIVFFFTLISAGCLSSDAEEVKFEKGIILINGKKITVELAETPEQRQQGLMNRKSMAHDSGMLFVFERAQTLSFWMKNTIIPLSIGFFDEDKKLINVLQMYPPKSVMVKDSQLPRYSSARPAKYALEMNIGWFKDQKVQPGNSFKFLKK